MLKLRKIALPIQDHRATERSPLLYCSVIRIVFQKSHIFNLLAFKHVLYLIQMLSQLIILRFKFISTVTFPYYRVAFFFPVDGRNPQIFLMNGFLCLLYFQIDKGLLCFFPVIILHNLNNFITLLLLLMEQYHETERKSHYELALLSVWLELKLSERI